MTNVNRVSVASDMADKIPSWARAISEAIGNRPPEAQV